MEKKKQNASTPINSQRTSILKVHSDLLIRQDKKSVSFASADGVPEEEGLGSSMRSSKINSGLTNTPEVSWYLTLRSADQNAELSEYMRL